MSNDLAAFLLARIADDEEIAKSDPARVLAECGAKRRIVERWQKLLPLDIDDHPGFAGERLGLARACQALAAVYADHPDYREEWRV